MLCFQLSLVLKVSLYFDPPKLRQFRMIKVWRIGVEIQGRVPTKGKTAL